MKVTKGDARRFLVARQLLAPARSLVGGPDAVLEVLRRLGSIQLDQVEVAGAATTSCCTRGSQTTTADIAQAHRKFERYFVAFEAGELSATISAEALLISS
jgi:uncharacterized protein YcaQ